MPKYVAFLRAINVGGHIVKMDRLQRLFEDNGCVDVQTVIASGNVIFQSPSRSETALAAKIARCLEDGLGYPVATFLRTPAELVAAARRKPFEGDAPNLYVGFLAKAPPAAAVRALRSLRDRRGRFSRRRPRGVLALPDELRPVGVLGSSPREDARSGDHSAEHHDGPAHRRQARGLTWRLVKRDPRLDPEVTPAARLRRSGARGAPHRRRGPADARARARALVALHDREGRAAGPCASPGSSSCGSAERSRPRSRSRRRSPGRSTSPTSRRSRSRSTS